VKKSNPLCIFRFLSVLLFFFIFGSINLEAERPGGAPMRSIEPDEDINIDKLLDNCLLLSPGYALLTENALSQPLTLQYIEQYSTPSYIVSLNNIMVRANLYLPFIREEINKRNLPLDLAFLPVIESSFRSSVVSRSGATGLWQFMMNSISPFDIKVTELIDERRDFIKSTRGALQKLQNEHRILGCWELTLAGYNSGINGLRRTMQRTGINDYWELSEENHIPQETINFVPRMVAATYVLTQPRRFGINIWLPKIEWEAIPLPRQISIDILADEAGINRELLHRMNAELNYGITPPDSSYRLKVPVSHLEQVKSILERQDVRLIRYHYHIISQGDSLWSISRHYDTTISMIEQHNPGISGRYLRIGETIIIPSFGDAPPPRPATPSNPVQSTTHNFNGTHVVQRGESFWSLSRMYNVPAQALAEANGMELTQTLHAGRTIKVPIIE